MTNQTPTADVLRALYRFKLIAYVERAFAELRPGVPFHYGHHIRAICHVLEQIERGEITRLIILMPPRHMKSHCASVVFPAWALGRNPSLRMICMSYGLDLAETFSRDTRRIIQSDLSQAVFRELLLDPTKASATELRTTLNGYRLATSAGGPLTGKGADILIADDISKAEDAASQSRRDNVWEWFTGTAMTRLDNPKTGAVILVAQRLHVDDLPGRLIAAGGWDVLELPAIETQDRLIPLAKGANWARKTGTALLPAHMDLPEFEAKRREIGSPTFDTQYQQSPTLAGGIIVRPEWFREIPITMRRSDYEAVIQSWDPAAVPGESNDYSVCTTWGLIGNHIDLLDVYRKQVVQPDLLRDAQLLGKKWSPKLLIVEAVGAGRGVYDHLRRNCSYGVRPLIPRQGKVERLSIQSPKIEAGLVRLPQSAPWKEAFLNEVVAFPNGKYDDQVDSMSQALFALDRQLGELRHCSRYKG
ncbi:phage terminase large subunit [Roseovarius arcticus]|uniref:phage terminase large subunit n=1 Tax=Roseovarius arcticus TaxID=2547404 RepID=UPI001486DDC9|nr:phage terminase large subunit [Roseovarius arcticus]